MSLRQKLSHLYNSDDGFDESISLRGYQGPLFRRAVAKAMAQVNVEIVKRSDVKGFVVLPKRWVVERTFAWLGRRRRLAKDWENLNRKALAFLRLASIRLMLRKLCNPT